MSCSLPSTFSIKADLRSNQALSSFWSCPESSTPAAFLPNAFFSQRRKCMDGFSIMPATFANMDHGMAFVEQPAGYDPPDDQFMISGGMSPGHSAVEIG